MFKLPAEERQEKQVSVEQAEADYYSELRASLASEVDPDQFEILGVPFGLANQDWEELKAQMEPGDELWEFCDAKHLWDALMGCAGYELRRNGVMIEMFITRMN